MVVQYYRADKRSGIEVLVPRGLYEDGGSCRPGDCSREVAFAGSPGQALYGLGQYYAHGDVGVDRRDFFDMDKQLEVYVYVTVLEPDYVPCPSSMDTALSVVTDFGLMEEVRYCRGVPVTYVGRYWYTGVEFAFLRSVIYNAVSEWSWFKVENLPLDTVFGGEYGIPDWNALERAYRRVLGGDRLFARRFVRSSKKEPDFMCLDAPEGIDEDTAMVLMEWFNYRFRELNAGRDPVG